MSRKLDSISELNIPFISVDKQKITVNTPVLNGHFFLYFLIFLLVTGVVFSTDVLGFQLIAIAVIIYIIWKVWDIFNYTNKVEIDFGEQVVIKQSKNIIKRIVFGIDNNVVYNFAEVEEFESEYLAHTRHFKDHIVRMNLKNGSAVAITTIFEEEQADELARVLNRLVK